MQLAEGQRLEGELKDHLERAHGEISRLQKVGETYRGAHDYPIHRIVSDICLKISLFSFYLTF